MFDLIGFILVLLGILGLFSVIALGTVISIILIVIGVACFAYARGAFARR